MRFWLGLLTALAIAAPAAAQPVRTAHLTAELVGQTRGAAPGQTVYLAVRESIDKGWHTYWRNPGDAGEPTRLTWSLPAGWRAGEIAWPAPHRLPVGPLMDYGYEGEVLLPVAVTAPADARPGTVAPVKVEADFLVCQETCVPAEAMLNLALPITAGPAPKDPRWGPAIDKALAAMPSPAGVSAVFQPGPRGVALAVTGEALKGVDAAGAYFYPYSDHAIEHAKPQAIDHGPEGLTLTLPPGAEFKAAAPGALDGVLVAGGRAFEIAARPGPLPPGASGLGPPPEPVRAPAPANLGLAAAALLAFAGGLILNLMPCVFPVLAMKAASLAGHGREQMTARRQGLAFAAGVLASFLALAGVLIGLKTAGAAVGWGFQLQSPAIVAALALLMLAVALNLSGVFEVGTSLQGVGSGLAARQGIVGGVFTGALSVVVAAPCTAPFMGPALGWALTQPPLAALAVFLALAVGFALPFVAVAYAPGLLARLPRPGPWMVSLRRALAFPMYAAAAWLAWVLTVQAGEAALARILGAAVAVALAAWLGGAAQRRRASGARSIGLASATAALAAAALAVGVALPYAAADATPKPGRSDGGVAQPYSPARLAQIRAAGEPAFVDYTAAWCVSCQVNERVALSTPRVTAAFRKDGIAYLKADWTRRDAAIAADLARFGRAGVPLYVLYPAGGGRPLILPAVLTEGLVLKALAAARAPGAAAVSPRSGSSV